MAKHKIYYWDDEEIFLRRFEERHSKDYEINTFSDTTKFMEALASTTELPDIVLLDLYQAKDKEEAGFEQRNALAEDALKRLANELDDVKKKVDAVREPIGIELLKLIRRTKETANIPIAIFTRRGLLILDDESIRDVTDHGGKWLLKNSKHGREHISRATEKIWIDTLIQEAMQSRQAGAAETPKSEALKVSETLRPERLTLGLILSSLTVPQLWALVTAALTALAAVAAVAYKLGGGNSGG